MLKYIFDCFTTREKCPSILQSLPLVHPRGLSWTYLSSSWSIYIHAVLGGNFKNKKVILRERKRHTLGGVPPPPHPPSVPPSTRPGWGTPPPRPGPGRGSPLGVDRQTDGWMDRHVSKHNLPSYYVRGR